MGAHVWGKCASMVLVSALAGEQTGETCSPPQVSSLKNDHLSSGCSV